VFPLHLDSAAGLKAVQDYAGAQPEESPAHDILDTQLRPADIPGSAKHVWVAPDQGGGLSIFVPVNDSFAYGHYSGSQLDKETAVSIASGAVVPGQPRNVIAVDVAKSGTAEPSVKSADGTARRIPFVNDVAVTTLGERDVYAAGDVNYTVPMDAELLQTGKFTPVR